MIKELIIDGKRSYTDFGLMIAERHISNPKKKSIKESIPFSNVVYDFSNINGEIYWEERTLTYKFDIAELTTEEMEVIKSDVMDWFMNVHDQDIYDPYIGDYHFHGSFDSDSWEEDFGSGKITVSFTVYPYKISNTELKKSIDSTNEPKEISIYNNSSHRISPKIVCDGQCTITMNRASYTIASGTFENTGFYLEKGNNVLSIVGDGRIEFSFRMERF